MQADTLSHRGIDAWLQDPQGRRLNFSTTPALAVEHQMTAVIELKKPQAFHLNWCKSRDAPSINAWCEIFRPLGHRPRPSVSPTKSWLRTTRIHSPDHRGIALSSPLREIIGCGRLTPEKVSFVWRSGDCVILRKRQNGWMRITRELSCMNLTRICTTRPQWGRISPFDLNSNQMKIVGRPRINVLCYGARLSSVEARRALNRRPRVHPPTSSNNRFK
ncbi:hypothetical protein DFH09DRAFT_5967 [Mycena vulgaris]|nr:hypothetical protein DFH09DRAFT_5967 [Mycena vulgaris]